MEAFNKLNAVSRRQIECSWSLWGDFFLQDEQIICIEDTSLTPTICRLKIPTYQREPYAGLALKLEYKLKSAHGDRSAGLDMCIEDQIPAKNINLSNTQAYAGLASKL